MSPNQSRRMPPLKMPNSSNPPHLANKRFFLAAALKSCSKTPARKIVIVQESQAAEGHVQVVIKSKVNR